MDLVTKDASGAVTEQMKLYAQSGKIRMEDVDVSSGQGMSMIFLGAEFMVLDHSKQTYIVVDETPPPVVQETGSGQWQGQAFEKMAKFIMTLADSMPGGLGAAMAENPMGLMNQIDGFPVRTVNFAAGVAQSETTLESVLEQGLDDGIFAAPDGYTKQDPLAGR